MKITGVILAGGLARRMNQQDKGLVCYQTRPLISYAIAALAPVVHETMINANRHHEQYEKFALPVFADTDSNFAGPLAGILTAFSYTDAEVLLIMPCDAPLMTSMALQQLLTARAAQDADIAVACEGQRWHSVFLAVHRRVQHSLAAYLASGERKIQTWLQQQKTVCVDFSDTPDIFTNINEFAELSALESKNQL